MSAATRLLDRLQHVRRSSEGRWMCRCPGHEDRSASLSIRELDDGRVLMHCFAGCETAVILAVVGLHVGDLFPAPLASRMAPSRDRSHWHGQRAAIQAMRDEATFLAVAAEDLASGKPLSKCDADRLAGAIARVRQASETLYGR